MLNQWQAAKHIKKDSAVGLRASQREWWEARSKKNTSQGMVGRAVETDEGKLGKGQGGKWRRQTEGEDGRARHERRKKEENIVGRWEMGRIRKRQGTRKAGNREKKKREPLEGRRGNIKNDG